MSEEKKDKFRGDRFTWEKGDLKKEESYPDESGTVFSTYYELKEFCEKMKEERENEPK